MESEVLKKFKNIYQDKRIVGHVQDGDLGNINIVRNFRNDIKIYLDPNHIKGKFARVLEKFNQKCNNCFSSFQNQLLHFFKYLLYNKTLTITQKKFQWINVHDHFIGKHGLCLHSFTNISNCPEPLTVTTNKSDDDNESFSSDKDSDDQNQYSAPPSEANTPEPIIDPVKYPNLLFYLKKFLEYTENLFDYVIPYYTTQGNESLNGLKCKFANKNTNWTSSFKTRMALCVLHKNDPYLYYSNILRQLNLHELNDESIEVLKRYEKISLQYKAKLRNPDFVSKRNKARFEYKNKKFMSSPNDHTIRPKEIKKNEAEIEYIVKSFRSINLEIEKPIRNNNKNVKKRERKLKLKNLHFESSDSDDSNEYDVNELKNLNDYDSDESDISTDSDESTYYNEFGLLLPDSDHDYQKTTNAEYDEEYIISSLAERYPKPTSDINAGLINCINSCYINSALQFIFSIPHIEKIFSNPKDECSTLAINLASVYFSAKDSEYSYNPVDFIKLYRLNNNLSTIPGDSVECFMKIMDLIEENFTVDTGLYKSSFYKEVECENGHCFEKENIELLINIQIINNQCEDLQENISNYFSNISFDEMFCPSDRKPVKCQFTIKINEISPILFFFIDRYYYSSESQNAERIYSCMNINNDIFIGEVCYEFRSSLLHLGSRLSGHYQIIIKNNDDFYLYDDAQVKKIENFQYSDYIEHYELLMYVRK